MSRLVGLGILLGAAFLGLGYRLVDLQVLRHQEFSVKAQRNTQEEALLEPRRGDILDVKGNLMATSVFVKTVCADPGLVGNRQAEVAHTLAPFLRKSESELLQRLTQTARRNDKGEITNHFVVLQKRVSVENWQQIELAMRNLVLVPDLKKLSASESAFYAALRTKAIFARNEQIRDYPNHQLAGHVLGYATTEEVELENQTISEIEGQDGIELTFNAKLSGVRGWRVTETDRQRRELVALREQEVEPRDGLNVVLTIDSVVQHILEMALADAMEKHSPTGVSGMVMRPRTGEILAMASLPNYDPCRPGDFTADERRNRTITDCVEPGSTFKVVVVSGALNDGTVTLTDSFDCEHGRFSFAGRVLHDHESYGVLTVEGIITHSSNIGAAKIGIKMGSTRLYDYISGFGFGSRTGIPLPGEVWGIAHPVKKWSKVSIAQIPMGQGIAVTRIQMMMAMCAIANRGWLMRPMLVDRLEDHDHNVVAKYSPQRVRQVVSEAAAQSMVAALKTVVMPDGTAPKAALERYTVAGKTGTAQKVENGVYAPGKYFSSFVGFFPADDPQLCISVMLDEPNLHKGYYGGQTAAPLFKQIAEAAASYLNIQPDVNLGTNGVDVALRPTDARSVKTAARSP